MRSTKRRSILIITLLLIAVLALTACGGDSAPAAAPADTSAPLDLPVNINAAQTNDIRNRDDVVILDVREDWEFAEGHIPGAAWIPLGELPNRLSEIPKDKTVVAVCRSGNRSSQATAFLQGQGFENVHNMTGGMNSWQQAGFEVER